MKDLLNILNELQKTPVPLILVGGGILFLFLAVGGQFGGSDTSGSTVKQKTAGIIGILLLILGVALYTVPIVVSSSTLTNSPQTVDTSLTISALDSELISYDNFDNPAFDGEWNPELWSRAKTDTSRPDGIQQQNGVLVAKSESVYAGLSSTPNVEFPLSEIDYIEAKLMLDDEFQGEFGSISLGLVSNETNTESQGESVNWWVNCQIETCQTTTWCEKPRKPELKCFSPTDYDQIGGIKVNYNSWHTARIKVDSDTVTFYFYFDGRYYDSYTPAIAEELKDDTFRIEIGSITFGASSVGYVDEVKFAKLSQE